MNQPIEMQIVIRMNAPRPGEMNLVETKNYVESLLDAAIDKKFGEYLRIYVTDHRKR